MLRPRRDASNRPGVVAGRQIVQRGDVPARDDQDMQRRLRVDVLERHQLIVLMDELAGNLAADDLAEEAVGHSPCASLE